MLEHDSIVIDWLGVEPLLVLSTFVIKERGRNKQRKRHKDQKKGGKRGGTIVKVFIGTQINLLNGWI